MKLTLKTLGKLSKKHWEREKLIVKLSLKIFINKKNTTNESIAMNFNNFFTEVGPNLSYEIVSSTKHFNDYITSIFQPEKAVSINEQKEEFFSLKTNKSVRYDTINLNIVKRCFGTLLQPLLHVLIFPLITIFPHTN